MCVKPKDTTVFNDENHEVWQTKSFGITLLNKHCLLSHILLNNIKYNDKLLASRLRYAFCSLQLVVQGNSHF